MPISPLPGVFNQVSWPGVGDVDDCQVIAAFWTMVASGWTKRADLPTVSKFRYEAGNPDDPARSDGLNNTESLRAIKRIWPAAGALSYIGDIEGFKLYVRSKGYVASVSVRSSLLPPEFRHGFLGLHQIAIALGTDGPVIMNPLNKGGATAPRIAWSDIRVAAYGVYNDGKVHAVIVPTRPAPVVPVDPHIAEIAALKAQVAVLTTQVNVLTTTKTALLSKITAAKTALEA